MFFGKMEKVELFKKKKVNGMGAGAGSTSSYHLHNIRSIE